MRLKPICRLSWLVILVAILNIAAPQARASSATTTTLTTSSGGATVPSGGSVASGSVVTLTATVTSGSVNVTTGQVNFCDATVSYCTDVHLLATAQLTGAGMATFKFRPGSGSHSYKAVFAGTPSYAKSASAAATLTVTHTGPYPSVTELAWTKGSGNYLLTATVGGAGTAAPTGTVSFLDASNANAVLGTATLGAAVTGPNFLNIASPVVPDSTVLIAVADFNGDGIPDLAVESPSGVVSVLLGNGDGTFAAATAGTATDDEPRIAAVGDFNGDGIPDLAVVGFSKGLLTILLGDGDGTFRLAAATPSAGPMPISMAAGDINGDGIQDLVVSNGVPSVAIPSGLQPGVTVFLGIGDGTFAQSTVELWDINTPGEIGVGDFNGDGNLDVVVLFPLDLQVLLGNGDGTFTQLSIPTGIDATPYEPEEMAVGDFNGDGNLDLAVLGYASNTATILLGNGTGFFTPAAVSPSFPNPASAVVVGDVNGDGIPDLIVTTGPSDDVGEAPTVLLGNGDGTFNQFPVSLPPGVSVINFFLADMNGDGFPDIGGSNLNLLQSTPQSASTNPTAVSILPIASGVHQVVASYPGNAGYGASTSVPAGLSAEPGTPSVTLAASVSPLTYGAQETFTATIAGSGVQPTGTVAFLDGATQLGTAALSGSGVASYSTSSLGGGSHSITANYSGDSNYNLASSAAYSLTVNPATPVVTLTSSLANPVAYGATITFTATLIGTRAVPTGSVTFLDGTTPLGTYVLAAGVATYRTSTLSSGPHSITASYTGDANYTPLTSSADAVVIWGSLASSVNLSLSSASITTAQALTVTVGVLGGSGDPTPTGTVTLSGGGYTSAATSLSSASATFILPAGSISAGADTLTASYSGDSNFASVTGSASITVTRATPTVTVTPSSSSITPGETLTVNVTVSAGANTVPATGTVTLTCGTYTSAASTLSGGAAVIHVAAGSLPNGADTLTVVYSRDAASTLIYNGASGTGSVTVALLTPTVEVRPSATSITTAQALTVNVYMGRGAGDPGPTGTVTLTGGGYTSAVTPLSSSSATFNLPAGSLTAGTDTLTVNYSGDSNFVSAIGSASITVTTPIGTMTPTVTVTATAATITNEQSDSVAVSVAGTAGNPTPTGSITLSSGTFTAQQTLAGGTASFTVPAGTLSSGANTLTAAYGGDPTYASGTGQTTVNVAAVVIAIPAPSSVAPGASTTATATLSGGSTYAGTLNLDCTLTSSPTGAQSLPTCSLTPASLTLASGASGTTVVTVATTAASTASLLRPTSQSLWGLGGGGSVLALLILCGVPSPQRRRMRMLAFLGLFAATLTIGCGGGSTSTSPPPIPATTAGAYTFTVTGTDSVNAAITTSATVTVTVE